MSSGSGINNKSGSLSSVFSSATSQATTEASAEAASTTTLVAVRNGNVVTASGAVYDLANAADVAKAKAETGTAGFDEVVQAAAAQGLTYNAATGTFTSDAVVASKVNKFTDDVSGKVSNDDADLIAQLKKANININTAALASTRSAILTGENATTFDNAVAATRDAQVNPTAANTSRAAGYVADLANNTGSNVMEVLYFVFRESIQQTNEDKKYFLQKLQDYNTMAEKLGDYLSDLVQDSQQLSEASAGAKYPEKVTIPISVSSFDTSTLNSSGEMVQKAGYPQTKTVDRAGLNDTIKDVESMQEDVRNKRQMASTAFQNFDQKSNQLYNLMASVLKVTNEMRSSTTRNML